MRCWAPANLRVGRGAEMAGKDLLPKVPSRSLPHKPAVVGLFLMWFCLSSAALGWLLVILAMYRGFYTVAGLQMPILVEIGGHYPWGLIVAFVLLEVIVALLALRSRRSGIWLAAELVTVTGLLLLLAWILPGNVYRPIFELDALLQSGR